MATGTTNPPGSNDPRDLRANAENLDLLITGPELNYPDRLGVSRRSWAGIDASYEEAEAQRDVVFQDHLANTGYELPSIPYAAGILVERETQLIERMGEFYRAKPGVVPFTTTGTWAADELNLVAVGDAALRQELASNTGAALVGLPTGRTVDDFVFEHRTISDFGARPGISNDCTQAVEDMAIALGYVIVGAGNYNLAVDQEIVVPTFFLPGASFHAPSGVVVQMRDRISSPAQYIFTGDGSFLLRYTTVGEDVYMVHASWYGVSPVYRSGVDQAVNFQRLFAALDSTRESVVDVDGGRYPMGSTSVIPRATWLRCSGSRRTVFEITGDGYDIFSMGSNGVRVTGCQFELSDTYPSPHRVNGAQIKLNQQLCEVDDVWFVTGNKCLDITAGQCVATNLNATFSSNADPGSSIVSISASDAKVSGLAVAASAFGPESLVDISDATGAVASFQVDGLRWSGVAKGVKVRSATASVRVGSVKNLHYRGLAGSPSPCMVQLETTGTGTVSDMIVDGVVTNEFAAGVLKVTQGSAGAIRSVSIDNVKTRGVTGTGLEFVRTSGALDRFTVGGNVDCGTFNTPVSKSGTMDVGVPWSVSGLGAPVGVREASIPNDSVVSIPFNRDIFSCSVQVTGGSSSWVDAVARPAPTSQITLKSASPNGAVTTGVLTGTTGAVGKLTVSVSASVLYVENRTGVSLDCSVTVLTGKRF